MNRLPLQTLLELSDSGVWGEEDNDRGVSILRSTNFNADGSIDFSNLAFRAIEERKRDSKLLRAGDILLEKSGGGPKQPVGRVCLFKGHDISHSFGNFIARLRPNSEILSEFLFYFLWYFHAIGQTSSYQKQTTGIRNLEFKRFLTIEVPVPPLAKQRHIVDILTRAESIVRLRREALKKTQEIIPALFLDMFGDPATNPKGWPPVRVADIGNVQGGLQVTKARQELPIELPYLRVANVYREKIDLAEVKKIRLTESEYKRVRLECGDLLVVEGHGNPSEVGRVGIWDGSISECVHQNHLIRIRCYADKANPEFLWAFLNSANGRQQLLKKGKTTSGLNTISTSNVKDCIVAAPPVPLQNEFANRIEQIRSIQSQATRALATAEATFQSLLHRAFAGEL
jgi:type I restriction enzyme S subunit